MSTQPGHVEPPIPLNAVIRIRAGDAAGYGIGPPARAECDACAVARMARIAGMECPYGKMHVFGTRVHTAMRLGQGGYSSVGGASDCRMRRHPMVPGSILGGWKLLVSAVVAYASAVEVIRFPECGGQLGTQSQCDERAEHP